jgi:glycosyltransferase involved in cell wall biosynthesis
MNILIYSHSWFPFISGITFRYQQIIDNLLKNNHKVVLITPYEDAIDYKGIKTIKIKGNKIPEFVFSNNDTRKNNRVADYSQYGILLFEILNICIQYNIDIIHASGPDTFQIVLKIVSLILNIPFVVMFHTNVIQYGLTYTNDPLLSEFIYNLPQKITNSFTPDLCVFPSTTFYKDFLESNLINKSDPVYILPLCLDSNIFYPSKKTKKNEWSENKIKLLYVGRIELEKSIDIIIQMMDSTMSLCIVGEGNDISRLKNMAKTRNVNVGFIGQVQNTELREWYSSTDIFIMPSKTETLGFVTLEAMACGSIVCGINKGGTLDIIKHKRNGFLFHNSDSLKKYIYKIHNNEKLRQKIRKNGLTFIKDKTIEKSVNGLCDEYKKLHRPERKMMIQNYFTQFKRLLDS